MFPARQVVLTPEDRVKQHDQERNDTYRKMLQGPVGNAIRVWCLADFETPNGILNSGSLAGTNKCARIASFTTSMAAGTDGSFTG